ncbi:MAG: WD40 repeat domain-containing protein, partial [Planctomycetota bacterium]
KPIRRPRLQLTDRRIYWQDFDFSSVATEFAVMRPGAGAEVYSLPDGELVTTLENDSPDSAVLAYSGDGKLAVATLRSGDITVYNRLAPNTKPDTKTVSALLSAVAWGDGGSRLAVGTDDGELMVWQSLTTSRPAVFRPFSQQIVAIHFRPNATEVMVSSLDDRVAVTDTASGDTLDLHGFESNMDLATNGFSDDGTKLGFYRRGEFGIIQFSDGVVYNLARESTAKSVTRVVFHPHDHAIFVRAVYGMAEVWDANRKVFLGELDLDNDVDIRFSPDGKTLYSSSHRFGVARQTVSMLRSERGSVSIDLSHRERFFTQPCSFFCLSQSGRSLGVATLTDDGTTLRVIGSDDGEVSHRFDVPARVRSLAFSACNMKLTAVDSSGILSTWSLENGELVQCAELCDSPSYSELTPTATDVLCSQGTTVRSFSVDPLRLQIECDLPERNYSNLAISPSGSLAAVSLDATTVLLLDAKTGQRIARLVGPHREPTRRLTFSNDESKLVIAGARHIQVWKLDALRVQLEATELWSNE